MKKIKIPELFAGLLLAGLPFAVQAGGLVCELGCVQVRDVPVGANVMAKLPDGGGYVISNSGSTELKVVLETVPPFTGTLSKDKSPLQPMPENAQWLKVNPQELTLPPNGSAKADIIFTVPDDPTLAGREFEGWIVAKPVGAQMSAGLVTRIRFNLVAGATNTSQPAVYKNKL
jgi:hypothetical protein